MSKKLTSNLFGNGDESEDELELKTNKNYAKHYNEFRKKEILSHLKNISESEESTSEDESDAEIDPAFDKEFLKTMAFLTDKNPQKYQQIPKFFDNLKAASKSADDEGTSRKSKKLLTVADFERKRMIETNGQVTQEDEISAPTNNEKSQKQIEEELKQAITKHTNASDDEDNFFVVKNKTEKERRQEESDYLKWLKDNKSQVPEDLAPLKSFWTNPNLSSEDKFLRDYIVKKKYAKDEDELSDYYDLSDDEKELEQQQEFEQEYNFRYEESGSNFIARHPRSNAESIRIENNKRKEARQERNERKKQEKELEMKKIREMRKIQKQDLEEKLLMIKEVAGMADMNIDEDFFNSEFDASKHDQLMQSTFGQNYYQVDEGEQKPEFPALEEDLEVENWDNFEVNDEPHCDDDDFNMDCEAPSTSSKRKLEIDPDILEATGGRKKRKKKTSKLAEIIKQKKPVFDPSVMNKTYEEYLDEYYKLDFEDVIGDMPCRFKYTECVPNDFGLSVEEILTASNKELNQWASLKKTMQSRPKHVEQNDIEKYERKRNNLELKKKIFKSIYGDPDEAEEDKDEDEPEKSKPTATVTSQQASTETSESQNQLKKKKKRKPQPKKPETAADRRLKTFSINPKKFKNKLKYAKYGKKQ